MTLDPKQILKFGMILKITNSLILRKYLKSNYLSILSLIHLGSRLRS